MEVSASSFEGGLNIVAGSRGKFDPYTHPARGKGRAKCGENKNENQAKSPKFADKFRFHKFHSHRGINRHSINK
jgi:hypothetical protein